MHYPTNVLPGNLARSPACGQHVHLCDTPVGLARIRDHAVNLVVWRRAFPTRANMSDRVGALRSRYLVDSTFDTGATDMSRCPDVEASLCRACAPFGDDVLTLADWFARLVGRSTIRVRLETLTGAAAPIFRVDGDPLRLLVTYAGEGAEWVENAGIRREQLDRPHRSFEEANRAIVRPGAAVYQARPGWVLLLKGDGYSGNAGRGIVYRPSPWAGSSGSGLQLTLCAQP